MTDEIHTGDEIRIEIEETPLPKQTIEEAGNLALDTEVPVIIEQSE